MQFIWDVEPVANWIISLILIIVVYGSILYFFLKCIRRMFPYWALGVSFAVSCLCFLFNLTYAYIATMFLTSLVLVLVGTANIGDFNKIIANPFKSVKTKPGNFGVEKIFDPEDFKKKVEEAILNLSQTKTGAIITFERSKSLNNFMKNGVRVDAPFTPELIETIFYEGTRLHDGAVIVHGNTIVAAAVFFTLTTQPFAVKYGSRHRAAIGISEVSDAVTIVVSEETGRISFAVNGTLEPVDPANFSRVFDIYMSDNLTAEQLIN